MKRLELSSFIRLLLLLALVAAWFAFYHYTDYPQYFTRDRISLTIDAVREFIDSFGIFGPILFVIAASLAITINAPTLLIIYLSAIIFGKVTGAFISFIFIVLGTTMIYFVAQILGRPFIKGLFGKRLRKVEERLDERGLMTVFYLRLIFFMSPAVNWLLSTTNISYRNLFLGTLLGAAHTIILNAWLSGMVIEIIKAGGSLNPIRTPKLLLPLGIGIFIFFTIKIIDRRRRMKRV